MIESKSKMPLEFKAFHALLGLITFLCITVIPLEYQIVNIHGIKFISSFLLVPFLFLFYCFIGNIYGFEYSRQVAYTVVIYRLLYLLFIQLAVYLPAAEFWKDQAQFSYVLSRNFNYILASSFSLLGCLLLLSYVIYFSCKMTRLAIVNQLISVPLVMLGYILLYQCFQKFNYSYCMNGNILVTLILYYFFVLPFNWLLKRIKKIEGIKPIDEDLSIFKFKTNFQVMTERGNKIIFKYHHFLFSIGVVIFIASKTMASKFITIHFLTINAGGIVFPLAYLLSDIMTDVYGIQRILQMIYFMLFTNFLFALIMNMIILLPSGLHHSQFPLLLNNQFTIFLASCFSFILGMKINSTVVSRLKQFQKHKQISLKKKSFLTTWLRFIASTVLGVFCDVSLFTLIAFYWVIPHYKLLGIIASVNIYKISYEFILVPCSVLLTIFIKIKEKVDIYDDADANKNNIFNLNITYKDSANKFLENYKDDGN